MNIFGIPVEFIIFVLMLAGIAIFHRQSFHFAVGGLLTLIAFKVGFLHFDIIHHLNIERSILLNLLGLLLGFAILSKLFEESNLPAIFPKFLPDNWTGGLVLLAIIFVLSIFLDNIAAALIGGTIAMVVFKNRVHIGFIAAIVAASNAGGAGSVIGDTTTTMIWIEGVPAVKVLHAFIAAITAQIFFGIFASLQQHKYQPIMKDAPADVHVKWRNLLVVMFILVGAIITNVYLDFPAIGAWVGIIIGVFMTKIPWKEVPKAISGTIFLIALVISASLMPVEELPSPSWQTTMGLGFLSSVFGGIPLTKLALVQNGYDWGMLAYAVGFGGSMIWFGSSAGIAICNLFPESRSVFPWIKSGWHILVAYILGFLALLLTLGWDPFFHTK